MRIARWSGAMRRSVLLGIGAAIVSALAAAAQVSCGRSSAEAVADAGDDALGDDAGASWLGDAGLVVRAPAPLPLRAVCGLASNPGDMPLGTDAASTALRAGYFDAAADLAGAGNTPLAIRRDFRWQEIEPARGTFDFTGYDTLADQAAARGVPLLGSLLYGATWARPGATDEYWPPADPADFATYAATTADHFRGRVAAWEVWNEPNMTLRFWKGTDSLEGDPAGYGALLAAAHDAVRARVPDVPVLLGGTVFTPQLIVGAIPWLEDAYAAHPDLAAHFEIAGAHTYAFYPPEHPPEIGEAADPPLAVKIQMHAWLLAQHGAADKPIWITEIGWPVAGSVDEPAQARFTVRATLLAAQAGAERVFWYTLRDGPHPDPKSFTPEDSFGLLTNDSRPKRAYLALKTLLALAGDRLVTNDATPLAGLPADAHTIVLRAPPPSTEPALVAAWTVTTASATATMARAASHAWDELGAETAPPAAGASVTLTPDVAYFEVP